MAYNHKIENGIDFIEIDGPLNLYSTPEVKKLTKSLLQKGSKKLLLNLKLVNFIDSSGLGMLSNLIFECKQKQAQIKLSELNSDITKLFTNTKLIESFEIYSTNGEAIQSF